MTITLISQLCIFPKCTTTKMRQRIPLYMLSFIYFQHIMAAMTHHKCYLYTMVGTESADVHTTHGLHLLEV